MKENSMDNQRQYLSEQFGLLAEKYELPRMAGRILGWLILCDPPHQSADEIMTAVNASKGTVSTMIRLLINLHFVEKCTVPGQRKDYYRLDDSRRIWKELLMFSVEQIADFRKVSEQALSLYEDQPDTNLTWLTELHHAFSFFESGILRMINEYERQNPGRQLSPHKKG